MARHAFLHLALLLAGVLACSSYTTEYDDVNVDAVLASDSLRNFYLYCLLCTGACDEKGRKLKEILPNLVSTKCDQCSIVQRRNVLKVWRYMRKNHPGDWAQMERMYDIQIN